MPVTNNAFVPLEELSSGAAPVGERLAQRLSVAAAQLLEAACRARGGELEASRAHVEHAMALLRGVPSLGPRNTPPSSSETKTTQGGLPAWKMRKLIAHVESNLSRQIQVQELAKLVDLSASHFCRAFKCAFDTTPHDYVLRRRIEVAQAMMLTTLEPLRLIAMNCGMCDQQHFTRSFSRIVGTPPSRWRQLRRASLNVDLPIGNLRPWDRASP